MSNAENHSITLSRGSAADLPALEPVWIAVLPDYRNRGIGTRLLEALEEALDDKGVHDLVLGALPGNAAAIRLYERRGYRPTWLYLSRLEANRGR